MRVVLRHFAGVIAFMVALSVLGAVHSQAGKRPGDAVVLKKGERVVLRQKEFASIQSDNPAVIKVIRDRRRGGFILIGQRRGSTMVRWTYKEGGRAFSGKWKYIVQ